MEKQILVASMYLSLEEKKGSASGDLKNVYEWALSEMEKGRRVKIYAISGEASPTTWNNSYLKEKIFTFLDKGGSQEHIIGPAISVENGEHSIVEAYKKNSNNMTLYMSKTRLPEHWILVESLNGDIHFVLRGEKYHKPLAEVRYAYEVKLDFNNNVDLGNKMCVYDTKKKEFEIIKGMELLVDKEFPLKDYCIEVKKLQEVISKIEQSGKDFDFLNKEEIMK